MSFSVMMSRIISICTVIEIIASISGVPRLAALCGTIINVNHNSCLTKNQISKVNSSNPTRRMNFVGFDKVEKFRIFETPKEGQNNILLYFLRISY